MAKNIEQFEMGEKAGKDNRSWLARQSNCVQFCLVFVPVICLTTAVIVLAILLSNEMNTPAPVPEATTPAPPPATPTICQSESCVVAAGSILASMDQKADPCKDFYQFTCGGYEKTENIPSGYSKYGSFDKARNLVLKNLREILETPGPNNEPEARAKSRRYYKECLDVDAINKNGGAALTKLVTDLGGFLLKSTQNVPNGWKLESLLEKRNKYSTTGLFTFYVSEDNRNVKTNIIQVTQGGLGLGSGSRDYYLNKNVTDDRNLAAYAALLTKYAQLIAGEDQVDPDVVRDVVLFEQILAANQLPTSAMRDDAVQYNKQSIAWLQTNANFMDWLAFFQGVFQALPTPIAITANEPVILFGTPYIVNLTQVVNEYLLTEAGKRTLHNYIVFQAMGDYAAKFGGAFQAASDEFEAIFFGTQGSLPRWQTCVSDTDGTVGFGLGALYIDKYFTQTGKDRAVHVIDSVTAAFTERMKAVDWMDPATKTQALAKMGTLTYEAAYPEWLKNDTYLNNYYSGLSITDNYVEDQFNSYTFSYKDHFGTLRKGPDPSRWYMTPQTVNAYYSPTQNKFVVPAGILSPPFFYQSPDVPYAINFAAIGTVTGHEIGHGFDDSGSQYDKDGNLANWWSDETLKAFQERAQCLVDQYNKYEEEGLNIDGRQTLGENIGDNGGLLASYQAYKTSVKPADETLLAGLNYNSDQLFFIGYAQVWCSLYTPEAMIQQIRTNVHSPGPQRVNGPVSNSQDFAKAFNCPVNSPMNPTKKCEVW